MKRGSNILGLMAFLGLLVSGLSAPALAQKGGGGSGGSGGGSGGGGSTGVVSSSLPFDDWGILYNGVFPHGQVVFSYSADGTYKTLNIQLSGINVPDGTVMTVETVEQWTTATGTAAIFSTYPVTIHQSKGLLSISTVNGDSVMFLTPFAGQTNVYIFAPKNTPLMGVQLGHLF
jgi:hypothetical protein